MTLPAQESSSLEPAPAAFGERPLGWRVGFSSVLATVMGLAAYSIPALAVLSGLVMGDLGIDRTEFGLTVTVIAASNAVSAVLAGGLVDRFGGRRVLLGVLALTAVSALLLAASHSFAGLLVGAAVSGAPNGASNPATNKVIAEVVPAGRRGGIVGTKQSGVQAGMFLVGLALPEVALLTSWRWALVAVAGVCLTALVVAGRLVPASPVATQVGRRAARRPLPAMIRWLVAYAALMGAGGAAVTSFLPLYAHEDVGLSLSEAGVAAAGVGLIGMAARIFLGRRVETLRHVGAPLGVLSLGAILSVLALMAAPASLVWLWLGVAGAGLTVATWNAITMLAAISVGGAQAGRATGWLVLGFMGGYAASPTLFGAVTEHSGGYSRAWWAVIGVFAAAAVLMALWWLSDRRHAPARSATAAP